MLARFTTEHVFNKLRINIYVDCKDKTAELTLVYDRLLRRTVPLAYVDVATPDLAESYVRKPTSGDHGSMIETLEVQFRNNWGAGAVDAA